MIFIVGKKHTDGVLQSVRKLGERCYVVGEIRKGTRNAIIRS
jgi:phosphoribosylaminoimidazole (AIR) synthetase